MGQGRVKNGCDNWRPTFKPGCKNSSLVTQQNSRPNSIYHIPVSLFYRPFSPSYVLYPSLLLPFALVFYSTRIAELYVAVGLWRAPSSIS
jgi:hypothetical protein